jgi:hypothetical protein
MDDTMGHVLCSGTQMEDGKNLVAGIYRQPDHVLRAAQPGSQFIQLEVWELQKAEGPLVQRLSMLKSASQPRGDGGLSKAEDAFSRGSVQPFGQRREHHANLLGGSFQMVQRCIASSAERGAARRTSERLDPLSMPMRAIPDERMPVCLGDPEEQTLLIGTGETLGIDTSGGRLAGF